MSEHKDRRIFGTRSAGRKKERWHGSTGYGVKGGAGVIVVRVRREGKIMEDLRQMTECSIVPAFGEQRKVRFQEKVLATEMPELQDNPGNKTLTSLKAVG